MVLTPQSYLTHLRRFLIVKVLSMCKTSLYTRMSRNPELAVALLGEPNVEGPREFGHNNETLETLRKEDVLTEKED
jgi:hypothetical protein